MVVVDDHVEGNRLKESFLGGTPGREKLVTEQEDVDCRGADAGNPAADAGDVAEGAAEDAHWVDYPRCG